VIRAALVGKSLRRPAAWARVVAPRKPSKRTFDTQWHQILTGRRGTGSCSYLVLKELLVDLIGIEPRTSSMPWNHQKRKLLTAKWLEVGITGKTGEIAPL
jgi:hypothetical protein